MKTGFFLLPLSLTLSLALPLAVSPALAAAAPAATAAATASGVRPAAPRAATLAQRQAEYVFRLFLLGCNSSRGDRKAVAHFMEQEGFTGASPSERKTFLFGGKGLAWRKETALGPFALSLTADGLCNAFAARADAAFLQQLLESWLPPAEDGYAVQTQDLPSQNDTTSRAYKLSRKGRPIADWILTTSEQADAPVQALLTFQAR